jgi:hypothetical protein
MPKKKAEAVSEVAPKQAPRTITGGALVKPETLASLNKPIDERMADLLKAHQKMGARPK